MSLFGKKDKGRGKGRGKSRELSDFSEEMEATQGTDDEYADDVAGTSTDSSSSRNLLGDGGELLGLLNSIELKSYANGTTKPFILRKETTTAPQVSGIINDRVDFFRKYTQNATKAGFNASRDRAAAELSSVGVKDPLTVAIESSRFMFIELAREGAVEFEDAVAEYQRIANLASEHYKKYLIVLDRCYDLMVKIGIEKEDIYDYWRKAILASYKEHTDNETRVMHEVQLLLSYASEEYAFTEETWEDFKAVIAHCATCESIEEAKENSPVHTEAELEEAAEEEKVAEIQQYLVTGNGTVDGIKLVLKASAAMRMLAKGRLFEAVLVGLVTKAEVQFKQYAIPVNLGNPDYDNTELDSDSVKELISAICDGTIEKTGFKLINAVNQVIEEAHASENKLIVLLYDVAFDKQELEDVNAELNRALAINGCRLACIHLSKNSSASEMIKGENIHHLDLDESDTFNNLVLIDKINKVCFI